MADQLLQPQAALETAVRDALKAALSLTDRDCGRTFNGQPPPACGQRYLAVWSPAGRDSQSRTSLDEVFKVHVTVTIRATGTTYDRWLRHRDDLEKLLNQARAAVHLDVLDHRISRAANALAGLDSPAATAHVGFREALAYVGLDDWQVVTGRWFQAAQEDLAGLAQTLRFSKSRRVQALANMV